MKQQVSAASIAARDVCGVICRSLVTLKVAVIPHLYLAPLITRIFGSASVSQNPNDWRANPPGLRSTSVDTRMWWTAGDEIDLQVFDEDDWRALIGDLAYDKAAQLGLFLTNIRPAESLRSRFEVRPGVLSVRPGGRAYVWVTFWHVQSESEALARLAAARCLLAH